MSEVKENRGESIWDPPRSVTESSSENSIDSSTFNSASFPATFQYYRNYSDVGTTKPIILIAKTHLAILLELSKS